MQKRFPFVRMIHLAMIIMAGCSDDQNRPLVYEVPSGFEETVRRFIHEGRSRGYPLDINNLIIKFDPAMKMPHCAKCNSSYLNPKIQKIITLNESFCWTNGQEMEALLFHELGHCFLGRQHTNETLPNGDPKSIMTPANISLYSPCDFSVGGEDCNYTFKRPYYLDELFDEGTPVPQWGQ
jgi:hypothetical protein